MNLLWRLLIIPSDAVIERELWRNLPVILDKNAKRVLAELGILIAGHLGVVHLPEQEARVLKSDGGSADGCALQIRVRRLISGEIVNATSRAVIAIRVGVDAEL